jgi:hypothetical protein
MINLDFDMMSAVDINVMVMKNIDGESVFNFLIEKNLGDREPKDFWLEIDNNSKFIKRY